MRGVALAAAGAAGAAAVIGSRFEQSLANIASVSVQARGQLGAIEKQARTLGATTAFSATQASDAMFNLALAGMDVNEIIGSSEAVLKFAGATLSDMASAAELTAITMATFSDQGVNAAQVANTLVRSTQLGLLSFERLDEALKKAAGTSGQFNIKFEEAVAALGIFSKAGILGAEAGTALRGIILELTANADKYAHILPKGIIETKGLAGVLDEVRERGIPAAEIMGLMGKRAGPAFGALIKAGSGSLRELQANITGTQAAWEAYEIQQNTVRGAFFRLRSALEEVAISAFRAVDTQLREGFDKAAGVVAAQGPRVAGIFASVADSLAKVGAWAVAGAEFVKEHATVIRGAAEGGLYFAGVLYAVATATKVASSWSLFMASSVNRWAVAIGVLAALLGVAHAKAGSWKNVWEDIRYHAEKVVITLQGIGRTIVAVGRFAGEGFVLLVRTVAESFGAAILIVDKFFDSAARMVAAGWRAIFSRTSLREALGGVVEEFTAGTAEMLAGFVDVGAEWEGVVERFEGGLDRMVAAQDKAIRDLKAKRAEQLAAREAEDGIEIVVPEVTIPEIEIPEVKIPDIAVPLAAELDEALVVADEFTRGMKGTWDRGWESLLEKDMTGKQRRELIWDEMRRASFKVVGDMVRSVVWGEAVKWKTVKTGEAMQTQAKMEGTSTRLALDAAERQSAATATTASVQAAAGKTFQAHAGIPFVGIVMAIGMIATMLAFMKALPKFARGGWIPGEGSRDSVLGMFTPDEFVVPREPARRFGPLLEGIRTGAIPDMSALAGAGMGGTTINVEVKVGEGSLLVVEDEDSWTRFATKLHDVIERVVKKRYRQQ
jgi:TP901 family phage tail tape measure protein